MQHKRKFSICLLFALFMNPSIFAENWPQWRGPAQNGSTTETNLPTNWSRTENIAWAAPLPGPSASTPIIWNDHVFISSDDREDNELIAACLDRKTGKERWRHVVAQGVRRDTRSTYSSPSPATNGEIVVFFYGQGSLLAFDYSGNKIWEKNIEDEYGRFAFLWTFSTSPVLYQNKLILQVLQRDTPVDGRGFKDRPNESYLLALDLKTGKEIWKKNRPSKARVESREAFTTPVIHTHNGQDELLIAGGDCLTGHDLSTGEERWRWGTWNPGRIGHWRLVPSPVSGNGTILVCAPKKDPIYAIRAGGSGVLTDKDIVWVSDEQRDLSSDVPTPAFYDSDFFILSDVRKTLSRVDPSTGEAKWTTRTPGREKYEASPLAADDKIYLVNFIGSVTIVDAKDGKIINTISMDEPAEDHVRSSVVAAGGHLFVRTNTHLYCIGSN